MLFRYDRFISLCVFTCLFSTFLLNSMDPDRAKWKQYKQEYDRASNEVDRSKKNISRFQSEINNWHCQLCQRKHSQQTRCQISNNITHLQKEIRDNTAVKNRAEQNMHRLSRLMQEEERLENERRVAAAQMEQEAKRLEKERRVAVQMEQEALRLAQLISQQQASVGQHEVESPSVRPDARGGIPESRNDGNASRLPGFEKSYRMEFIDKYYPENYDRPCPAIELSLWDNLSQRALRRILLCGEIAGTGVGSGFLKAGAKYGSKLLTGSGAALTSLGLHSLFLTLASSSDFSDEPNPILDKYQKDLLVDFMFEKDAQDQLDTSRPIHTAVGYKNEDAEIRYDLWQTNPLNIEVGNEVTSHTSVRLSEPSLHRESLTRDEVGTFFRGQQNPATADWSASRISKILAQPHPDSSITFSLSDGIPGTGVSDTELNSFISGQSENFVQMQEDLHLHEKAVYWQNESEPAILKGIPFGVGIGDPIKSKIFAEFKVEPAGLRETFVKRVITAQIDDVAKRKIATLLQSEWLANIYLNALAPKLEALNSEENIRVYITEPLEHFKTILADCDSIPSLDQTERGLLNKMSRTIEELTSAKNRRAQAIQPFVERTLDKSWYNPWSGKTIVLDSGIQRAIMETNSLTELKDIADSGSVRLPARLIYNIKLLDGQIKILEYKKELYQQSMEHLAEKRTEVITISMASELQEQKTWPQDRKDQEEAEYERVLNQLDIHIQTFTNIKERGHAQDFYGLLKESLESGIVDYNSGCLNNLFNSRGLDKKYLPGLINVAAPLFAAEQKIELYRRKISILDSNYNFGDFNENAREFLNDSNIPISLLVRALQNRDIEDSLRQEIDNLNDLASQRLAASDEQLSGIDKNIQVSVRTIEGMVFRSPVLFIDIVPATVDMTQSFTSQSKNILQNHDVSIEKLKTVDNYSGIKTDIETDIQQINQLADMSVQCAKLFPEASEYYDMAITYTADVIDARIEGNSEEAAIFENAAGAMQQLGNAVIIIGNCAISIGKGAVLGTIRNITNIPEALKNLMLAGGEVLRFAVIHGAREDAMRTAMLRDMAASFGCSEETVNQLDEAVQYQNQAIERLGQSTIDILLKHPKILADLSKEIATRVWNAPIEEKCEMLGEALGTFFGPGIVGKYGRIVGRVIAELARESETFKKVMLGINILYTTESANLVQFGGRVMSDQLAYRLNKLRTKIGIAFTDERLVDAYFKSMCPVAHIVEEVVRSQNPEIFNAPTTKPFDPAQPVRKAISLAGYDASLGDLNKLEKAANMFNKYPSAVSKDGPLKKLLEYGKPGSPGLGTARGHAYELEKAYDLVQAGEEVLEFGKKITGPNFTREFDIITPNKFIECKAIDWAKASVQNVKDRAIGQLVIAKSQGKIYEFHSKNNIPLDIKSWFKLKGIRYFEG